MDISQDLQTELQTTIAKLQVQASSSLASPATAATLSSSGATLQNWYNEALTGGLSSADIAALQADLGTAQQASLAADAASDQKKLIIGAVAGVLLVVGGIIYFKYKKAKP